MLRHYVFLRYREGTSSEHVAAFCERMLALRGPYAAVGLMQDMARGADFAGAFQQRFAMRYEDFQAMVARD